MDGAASLSLGRVGGAWGGCPVEREGCDRMLTTRRPLTGNTGIVACTRQPALFASYQNLDID